MKLNNHFLVTIIDDVFEAFLDEKGIVVENEDRDAEGSECNIFGDDFEAVMTMLRDVCERFGIHVEDNWDRSEG